MEPELGAAQPQFTSREMACTFDEFHGLISGPPVSGGSSFTSLLELSPPQAVELLFKEDIPAKHPQPQPIFPNDIDLMHRVSKLSIFASAGNSLESNTILSITNLMKVDAVKQEQLDADSRRNSSPEGSDQCLKSGKRKKREKKVRESNKKSKNKAANKPSDDGDGEELPYVHVRARRGQATDSHSLAERARREKINARMKLLQELVPGCNKVSGTAMVLDEIINHVQALQRQVEFLSMRLAAVSPGNDFDLDSLFAANGPSNDTSYTGMIAPPICTEGQLDVTRQLQLQQLWHCDELHQSVWARQADTSGFIAPANSLLS